MKNLIFIFCLLVSVNLVSQSNILNVKSPELIGVKNIDQKQSDEESSFLEYGVIDDRDILWSKIVYEKIDLNEKLNFPLLFPVIDSKDKNRKSLWRIIKENIVNGNITETYDYADDGNFFQENKIKKYEERLTRFKEILVDEDEDEEALEEAKSKDIKEYWIKGIWYFDKRQSEMKYRLLGIMPYGKNFGDDEVGDVGYFWIWYPSIREILHKEMVYNDKNNANRISFDQLLISRRFNSYIYKEDNINGNRAIEVYKKKGLQSILESERIKKEILDFEQDMWNR
ncbi:gliding motility protein GldN [Flavobacteriaceae bacterium]|nr:gliding motility protein GldN [Flavobacteriaceae bacterium]